MKTLNSIEKAKYISNEYKEYLKSSFKFGNDIYQELFSKQLDEENLFKGPYINLNMPFTKSCSLNNLIDEGIITEEFRRSESFNLDRPLYYHQEMAIRKIASGHNVVITTGTGSGKTECFLYPTLNGIMKDIKSGNNSPGIRALFLYPMNALVNDQMDRLRKILSDYPEITYANFTGDTKETISKSERQKISDERGISIPDNELLSREEIRENPPHILFTNYSMLEYLLIRPSDQKLFNTEYLNNWKYIVLDEAHTYSGSKGIELSLLLRRVTGFAKKKPLFILTSATLGEQGKSENEILSFATQLTSSLFESDDIIFSKRDILTENPEYKIDENDYLKIYDEIDNINVLKDIVSKYLNIEKDNYKELLYDLLSKDINVHIIYEKLKNGCLPFDELYRNFDNSIKQDNLIILIDLINKCEKNGSQLFDLKYHSFVKALSGIYTTLDNDVELTLTKTNYLNNKKAFEIGNCRFCNTSFIVGQERFNPKDGLKYLRQNDEVDIYENYGDNEKYKIDYYLLDSNDVENLNEEVGLVNKTVCTTCGQIFDSEDLNAKKCTCKNNNYKKIYQVVDNSATRTSFNNISCCPCCGKTSKSGIIRTLNLGKDEGTAIISQILYRCMETDDDKVNVESENEISLVANVKEKENNIIKAKQYLAFSDSRQQASFYSVFMSHNHHRMLNKRLLWKIIEDSDYQNGIKIDLVVSKLTKLIREKNLYDNNLSYEKNAWAAALVELLKVDGRYGGEGLGLFNFSLDLSYVMEKLSDSAVEKAFGKYGINKNDFENLIQLVLSQFRTVPAIDISNSSLTPEEKKEVLEYRRFDNYVAYQKPERSSDKDVKSFLPVRNSENSVVRLVMKMCNNCTTNEAIEILNIIFNNIAVPNLLKKHSTKDLYQIEASKYVLNNYKNTKYYRCKKCGSITPYNIHNKCIEDDCEGELELIDPDVSLAHNYYRKEYKTKIIERMVIREHTAQLTREKAKQYQDDFKNKLINILSCSTTFEMGIDIGDLETVFMRNVPPTPANYVQRAGRAGRSKETASFILTYCNLSSHDYTYFNSPEGMISGLIRPPYFIVSNEKIIVRHLLASSLGFFFRKNPDMYKSIESFVFENGIDLFRNYIATKPEDLNEYINNHVLDKDLYNKYANFKWFNDEKINNNLSQFEDSIKGLLKELEDALKTCATIEDYGEAEYYKNQIKHLKSEKVIDNLSKYCVIPKYGFPVDIAELKVYTENGHLDNRYDLNRDLKVAISEYAPDSEIIVDGNKYTSQYITIPKGNQLRRYYFANCETCGRTNISFTKLNGCNCKYCNSKLNNETEEYFLEPSYGFKTGQNKESTSMKPVKSYSGEIQYIGGGDIDDNKFEIENVLSIETSTNDELLVMNKSNFYMCPVCGFSKIDKKNSGLPFVNEKHVNCYKKECENKQLEKIRLGHIFKTDVAKISCKCVGIDEYDSKAKALSFLYALLEGISKSINIERNDIDGLIIPNLDKGCFDILIYDNVPGGAGHVKRISNIKNIRDALFAAKEKVSQKCCDEDTSCYNCLRNYYNQSFHGMLKRKYALEIINDILKQMMSI